MGDAALRILVVEDHAELGRFIAAALGTAGWLVVGPLTETAQALDAAQRLALDLAVVDRLLAGEEASAIVDALAARRIRCLLISGHPRSTLPDRFRDLPFLEKPFSMQALVAAVRGVLEQRSRPGSA